MIYISSRSFLQYHYAAIRFEALPDHFWAMGFWWTHPITWKQACRLYSAFVWPVPATTNIRLTRSNSVASEKCYRQEMWNIIELTYYALQIRYTRYNTICFFQKSVDQFNGQSITSVIREKKSLFKFTQINRHCPRYHIWFTALCERYCKKIFE